MGMVSWRRDSKSKKPESGEKPKAAPRESLDVLASEYLAVSDEMSALAARKSVISERLLEAMEVSDVGRFPLDNFRDVVITPDNGKVPITKKLLVERFKEQGTEFWANLPTKNKKYLRISSQRGEETPPD